MTQLGKIFIRKVQFSIYEYDIGGKSVCVYTYTYTYTHIHLFEESIINKISFKNYQNSLI